VIELLFADIWDKSSCRAVQPYLILLREASL
jgi:hypothetical protein